jgi:CHASE2 domain-containing sensor protein/predicted Ser/Thr protein kinase
MGRLRSRRIGLTAIVLLGVFVGVTLHGSGALSWLEQKTVDVRFSIRGRQPPPRDVVVVGLDNSSVGRLPRYPIPRRYVAQAIDNLRAAGARLIAYDVAFDRPTDPEDDMSLLDAARRAAPIVFGTTLITLSGATEFLGREGLLQTVGGRPGAADLPPGSDGVIRRPLAQLHHLPSFASAVAAELGRKAPSTSVVSHAYIDFHGRAGTISAVPFWRVVAGQFDPQSVRGKVVVVGLTAPVLQDVHPTAVGGLVSGPEIQAEAISTALRGYPLRDPPTIEAVLIIVLVALVVPLVDALFGSVAAAIGAGLAFLVWTLAAQLAFDGGTVVDYTSSSAAMFTSVLGVWTIETIADSRERRRLRGLFAADAPEVVEEVLNAAEGGRAVGPTDIIAGYRLEEQIGKGGMGVVYRATQLALDRRVAVKLIAADKSKDSEFRERFKRESRLAAAIEHPNVVTVFDAGEDHGLLFIAMRYVDGVDLAQYLRVGGRLRLDVAARLTAQVASALDAAHAMGLVHRDVKPANVLLTSDKQPHVYLTDFGIAKHLTSDSGLTQTDALIGTVDYMAPEHIRGEPTDQRADIYSLAGLLYYALIGEPPFPRDHEAAKLWAHVSAPPPVPSATRPDLPEALDVIVATGLAKLPADRYAEAGQLAAAVVHLARLDVWADTGEIIDSAAPAPEEEPTA